jgi:hypothetical protein
MRVHGIDNLRHQHHRGQATVIVAAGLNPGLITSTPL